MPVTSHDVARLAGVSQATVSAPCATTPVYRGDEGVCARPRNTRLRAERARSWPVDADHPARRARRRTAQHALPPADGPDPRRAAGRGYRMSLLAEHDDDVSVIDRLLDRSVDGAILMTTRLTAIRLPTLSAAACRSCSSTASVRSPTRRA